MENQAYNRIKNTFRNWFSLCDGIYYFISAEFLLKNRDNGGCVIILRSFWASTIIFHLVIVVLNLIDPSKSIKDTFLSEPINLTVLYKLLVTLFNFFQKEIHAKFTWFGIFFATVYAALYTRFASQWEYLANLYNSIKRQSCLKEINEDAMAEWKAGFIEDAEYLHLAYKKSFAPIIQAWGNQAKIKEKYNKNTPGGNDRLENLLSNIEKRVNKISKEYRKQ